jgi:hypothetical protein
MQKPSWNANQCHNIIGKLKKTSVMHMKNDALKLNMSAMEHICHLTVNIIIR